MISLFMLRHGTTAWNLEKRVQGHTDIPLLPDTRQELSQLRLASRYRDLAWYCSPLTRTRQTAQAIGLVATPEPALIEMAWGSWEGKTIEGLRRAAPQQMAREEARGRFMTPEGGECPQQVIDRLLSWLATLQPKTDIGVVTHKGVIRAALAEACRWDMVERCPVKPDWGRLLEFSWSAEQGLCFVQCNLPLEGD
ncbi:histidine phosphatase family protein [Aestuariirhabdus litorea]|uniref:Histidine phosphatase family protein n=1 Tax=Aestuariirhabdus litorea TaxID=2528527 RepID=A0A3P3VR10_9GAMM|nr:histidine phosphatase family protein [Aestuariirhabdus litorea]RRJ84747.1 histidine phosphatase family protein [Aestuariirhabdus litorea]RWW97972.1 histidine phosphatase family protein [Endozoicomonadaceae bacterium GTF-13]